MDKEQKKARKNKSIYTDKFLLVKTVETLQKVPFSTLFIILSLMHNFIHTYTENKEL